MNSGPRQPAPAVSPGGTKQEPRERTAAPPSILVDPIEAAVAKRLRQAAGVDVRESPVGEIIDEDPFGIEDDDPPAHPPMPSIVGPSSAPTKPRKRRTTKKKAAKAVKAAKPAGGVKKRRGRPPMTDAQKAAAKAKREADAEAAKPVKARKKSKSTKPKPPTKTPKAQSKPSSKSPAPYIVNMDELSSSEIRARCEAIYALEVEVEKKRALYDAARRGARAAKESLTSAEEHLENEIRQQREGPGPLFASSGEKSAQAR